MTAMFNQIDSSQDGFVSLAEFKAALKGPGENPRLKRMLKDSDPATQTMEQPQAMSIADDF